MLKNFNPATLGVSGRQSELIELALTYEFDCMSVDLAELARKSKSQGVDYATRFLRSASIPVGDSPLPMELHAEENAFEAGVAQMEMLCEVSDAVQNQRFVASIRPFITRLAYHESFEQLRQRLVRLAEILDSKNKQLGLLLLASPARRKEPASQEFIHRVEEILALISSVGSNRVGLALDTWNWWVGGGTIEQLQALPVEKLVSVRLSGVPSDASAESITEKQRCWPDDEKNILDVQAIVNHLRDSKFAGPLAIATSGTSLSGRTREFLVQRASKLLASLISGGEIGEEIAEIEEVVTEDVDASEMVGSDG